MTYSLTGFVNNGVPHDPECESDGETRLYDAQINDNDTVVISNPGGPFDGVTLAKMMSGVDPHTLTNVDGSGHDASDPVELGFDGAGCEDTVQLDVSQFEGDFSLNVSEIQTIDKLYVCNVLSFAAIGKDGEPISPIFTYDNVYGGGESGDQNGAEFGEGSYNLEETGNSDLAYYEIEYIDRNGEQKTITLNADVAATSANASSDGPGELPSQGVPPEEILKAKLGIKFDNPPPPGPPPPPPICFAAGTMIVVEGGTKAAEELHPGDMVLTKDNGYQPIRWIARRKVPRSELEANAALRPIRIRAGALGENMPSTDLVVSPQHRMLVSDWRCEAMFGEAEMLVPAKALVNDGTVTVDHDADGVEYVHFMFEQHEIVFANGVESESFHPGEFGLSTLNEAALEELFLVFPHLEKDIAAFGATARPVLKAFEARAMLSA